MPIDKHEAMLFATIDGIIAAFTSKVQILVHGNITDPGSWEHNRPGLTNELCIDINRQKQL
jgi:hypothetical protein